MSVLSINLPESMHKCVAELAEQEGVSVEHFVATAVAEKVCALSAQEYLQERAHRGSREDLKRVLEEVLDRKPADIESSS